MATGIALTAGDLHRRQDVGGRVRRARPRHCVFSPALRSSNRAESRGRHRPLRTADAGPGLALRAALDPRGPPAAGKGAAVNQSTRRIVETLVLAGTSVLLLGHGIGGSPPACLTRKGETRSYNVVGTCGPTGVVTVSWSPSTFCSVTLTGDDVGLPTSGNSRSRSQCRVRSHREHQPRLGSGVQRLPAPLRRRRRSRGRGFPQPRLRATPLPRQPDRLAGPRALVPGRPVARDARLRHPRLPGRDLFQPGAHGLSRVWLLSRVRSQRTERRRPDPAAPRLPHRDLPPELPGRARAVLADRSRYLLRHLPDTVADSAWMGGPSG